MTDAPRYKFTIRQRQVLKRIADGKSYKAIAAELGIAVRTVRIHAAAVADRLRGYDHLPARAAIVQFAHESERD